MYIKKLKDCAKFVAGDGSILREILHPAKANLKLRYSLAHAVVKAGQKTKLHQLRTSEVYYILSGSGAMHIGDEVRKVGRGDTVYIPPKSRQWIENISKKSLEFICIVDPAWRAEDEKIS
jgi:mannose-6-phosphate isomerase-like protein (cupin superfamily)